MNQVNNWYAEGTTKVQLEVQLEELKSNSKIIGGTEDNELRKIEESTQGNYVRELLESEDSLAQLKALEQVPGHTKDSSFILDFLKRKGKPIDKQNLSELNLSLKIARWIEPLEMEYPKPFEVYAEMKHRESLLPFKALVENFEGRKTELKRIQNYVDWFPKEGLAQKTMSFIRKVMDWHNKDPLLITGIGGIGKSTLVAKFILNHVESNKVLPFVYIDFDNVSYDYNEPLFILLEAFDQLQIQFPKHQHVF